MSNFIKDCIAGDALMSDIDDYIDSWHESDSDLSLSEFLGMSPEDYQLYVEDAAYLATIITAHKRGEKIFTVMREHLALAARSDDSAKAKRLQKWLESENLWD